MPGFLLKICPDTARIFTKMSPDEELVTLIMVDMEVDEEVVEADEVVDGGGGGGR